VGEDLTHEEPPARERGIGRRALIKRAAAAGAVAWTAPVILDSLSSPAAAFSCGTCFKFGILAVDSGQATPIDTYPARSYGAGTCLPNGDSTCSTVVQNATASTYGVSFDATSGTFNVNTSNTVKVDIAGTGTSFGCSQNPTILGATFMWRTTTADPNHDQIGDTTVTGIGKSATSDLSVCELAKQGDTAGQGGRSYPFNHLVAITQKTVTWQMPQSTKPGHSGGFNFVIGCTC
jgi:hypothetical protein